MKVSFIICTRNRENSILACLSAIEVSIATAKLTSCEIVVVDNGSADKTPSVLQDWAQNTSVQTQLINEPKAGLSRARNAGFLAAKGDIIACTDDDCCLHDGFVVDMLNHFDKDSDPVLRGGRVELGNEGDLPLSVKMQDHKQSWQGDDGQALHNLGDSLMGCSFTMPRAVFDAVGLFDVKLGAGAKVAGAEDTDFIYRAYLKGIKIEYVPDMALSHFHGRKTQAEGRKLFENYALGWGALYMKYAFKHPQFLKPFVWDFKNALRELRSGENTFRPDANFSYKDKVRYSVVGAFKYLMP